MTKRRGRPSKGLRAMRSVRLPIDLDRGLIEFAEQQGQTINDLVTIALREHLARAGYTPPTTDHQLQMTA